MLLPYSSDAPTPDEVASMPGATLLEFGVDWCPHCQAAMGFIDAALRQHGGMQHLRLEDGRGRPLGRACGVKLWPTLILLRDGAELGRVVRPTTLGEVAALLALLKG